MLAYEHPDLRTTLVDLDLSGRRRVAPLMSELGLAGDDDVIAWRGEHRYVEAAFARDARCRRSTTRSFGRTAPTSSPVVSAASVWSSPAGWSTAAPGASCSTVDPSRPMSSGAVLDGARSSAPQIAVVLGDIAAPGVAERLVSGRRRDRAGVARRRAQRRRARRPDRRRPQQGEPGAGLGAEGRWRAAAARRHGRPRARLVGRLLLDVVAAGCARAGRLRRRERVARRPGRRGDGHRVCLPPRSTGASGPTSAWPAR